MNRPEESGFKQKPGCRDIHTSFAKISGLYLPYLIGKGGIFSCQPRGLLN
jgi:hypothetical protein